MVGTLSDGQKAVCVAAGIAAGCAIGFGGIGMTWALTPAMMGLGMPEAVALETALYALTPATVVAAWKHYVAGHVGHWVLYTVPLTFGAIVGGVGVGLTGLDPRDFENEELALITGLLTVYMFSHGLWMMRP